MIRITIKFFAILRDRAGTSETVLEVPDGATIDDAVELLSKRFTGLETALSRAAFAVNQEYESRDIELHDGDELALIPPVSGG